MITTEKKGMNMRGEIMKEIVGAVILDQSLSTRMRGDLWTWEGKQDLILLVLMVMHHLTNHQGNWVG